MPAPPIHQRPRRPRQPDAYDPDEAPTGRTEQRQRLVALWLQASDRFTDHELTVMIEVVHTMADASPGERSLMIVRAMSVNKRRAR